MRHETRNLPLCRSALALVVIASTATGQTPPPRRELRWGPSEDPEIRASEEAILRLMPQGSSSIAPVLSEARALFPHFLNLLRPEASDRFGPRRDHLDRSVALSGLAASATDRDRDAVEAIGYWAFGGQGSSLAVDALLYIGGTCIDDVLRHAEDGTLSTELVDHVMRTLWTLRASTEDLERAALTLERMSRTHADAAIRSRAESLGLRPLRAVVQVRTRPDAPETHDLLRRVIHRDFARGFPFSAIHGSEHWFWAVLQLANVRAPDAAAEIRRLLAAPGERCEVLMFLLYALRKVEPLTPDEEAWAAAHQGRCRWPMPRVWCLDDERPGLREVMGATHSDRYRPECECIRPWTGAPRQRK